MEKLLKEFLEKKAEVLSKPVMDFMDSQVVYQTEDTDCEEVSGRNEKAKFLKVTEATREWLRAVALCSMLENRKKVREEVSLVVPDDDVSVSVSMDGVFCDHYIEQGDVAQTPIGVIDAYVYEAILGVKNNPIILLYQFFDEQLRKERSLMAGKDGSSTPILTRSVLERYGVNDVLGVYRMESLMQGINAFLHPDRSVV